MWQQSMSWVAADSPGRGGTVDGGVFVRTAARVSGAHADAWVVVDQAEHRRRATTGLAAVTDLALLDALLDLPLGEQVPGAVIGAEAAYRLRGAPEGVVDCSSGAVRRLFTPAASVHLVVVPARSWRSSLRRAAAFAPFAARVMKVPRAPGPESLWEANVLGIGVWLDHGPGEPEVLLPHAPWKSTHIKAAGWRFREHAYTAWLNAAGDSPAPTR